MYVIETFDNAGKDSELIILLTFFHKFGTLFVFLLNSEGLCGSNPL